LPFIPGSIIGATLGTLVYFELPEAFIALMLGCVMLWFSWVPATERSRELAARIPQPWFIVGILHTFLSTVSGAGPDAVADGEKQAGQTRSGRHHRRHPAVHGDLQVGGLPAGRL